MISDKYNLLFNTIFIQDITEKSEIVSVSGSVKTEAVLNKDTPQIVRKIIQTCMQVPWFSFRILE